VTPHEAEKLFRYHEPTPKQADQMAYLRILFQNLAKEIVERVPNIHGYRDAAIKKLHMTQMTCNEAISMEDK